MIITIIIMVFYGREKEIQLLQKLYKKLPGMVVITGRRRVGKTSLIREFIKDKKSLYFFVDNNKTIDILIQDFYHQITDTLDLPGYVKITTPEDLLDFLFSCREDLIIVFDEFQRFNDIYPAFITQLQNKWDMMGESSRLFIITSGSSVGMMNKIFLEGGAPLFKRADTILTLKPFSPAGIWTYLENIGIHDREEKLKLYLLFGGMIYYYRLAEKYGCNSFDSALKSLVFDEFGPLKDEVKDVLVEEFGRLHPTYYEIISALARGRSTQKEIADMTHIAPGSLTVYLNNLIHLLGIVEYRIPATEKHGHSKKGRYVLKDNFFGFYAYFIYPNMSSFISGRDNSTIEHLVHKEWQSYSGRVFEDLSRILLLNRFSRGYEMTGGWWNRRGDEIDFIATGTSKIPVAIEVKSRTLSAEDALLVLRKLENKLSLIPGFFDTACPETTISGDEKTRDVITGIVAKDMSATDRAVLSEKGHIFYDIFELIEESDGNQ
ncbi:ATP-binding protein [Methanogenium sp. S4BF]|uniref:ATP-binding protein n=1 Tax=Methanogenium sp. S4BF TaxID=1789226 RepID=UPI0024168312|nr:ATP-binding protein [Methanogenium sp. S4BF]WFN34229.1 ATP-binding protein [Methanogenium sp. S4BF]